MLGSSATAEGGNDNSDVDVVALADRNGRLNRLTMKQSLLAIAIFEGLFAVFFLGVSIAAFTVSAIDYTKGVYVGLTPGAAAFVASFVSFATGGGLLYSSVKQTFYDDVIPVRFQRLSPCRCRMLGILLLAVFAQAVFVAWGLSTVLQSFANYDSLVDDDSTIDSVEAIALCDIVGRIVYFVVILIVAFRIAHLWGNVVRIWAVQEQFGQNDTAAAATAAEEEAPRKGRPMTQITNSTADTAVGGYVPVTLNSGGGTEVDLGAVAFGEAIESSDSARFPLVLTNTPDAQFERQWFSLPVTGSFSRDIAVPAAMSLTAVSQHLMHQGFEVVGEGNLGNGNFRVFFLGAREPPWTAFLGKFDFTNLSGESASPVGLAGNESTSNSVSKESPLPPRYYRLKAEFRTSDSAAQPLFVSRLRLGEVLSLRAGIEL